MKTSRRLDGVGSIAPSFERKPCEGSRGIAFVESLRAQVAAFAGLDARPPMRRDLLRKMTIDQARAEGVAEGVP